MPLPFSTFPSACLLRVKESFFVRPPVWRRYVFNFTLFDTILPAKAMLVAARAPVGTSWRAPQHFVASRQLGLERFALFD
jgi:hypothetical protein